jgi:hypothetical protein
LTLAELTEDYVVIHLFAGPRSTLGRFTHLLFVADGDHGQGAPRYSVRLWHRAFLLRSDPGHVYRWHVLTHPQHEEGASYRVYGYDPVTRQYHHIESFELSG